MTQPTNGTEPTKPASAYRIRKEEFYRLVRGHNVNGVLMPIEAVKPCAPTWRCHTGTEECPSFRGYDPNTRLIACTARELKDEPIDRKRFFILATMIGQTQHDLMKVLLDMDEPNLDAIISGQHNIRAKIVLEPNIDESYEGE